MADLLVKGKTGKMKGWKLSGTGAEVEGRLVLNAAFDLEITP
ncbi:hypothetical protein [Paraflavitalea speifideaquila]